MGLLSDVSPQDSSKGYPAFLWLVGTTYFQKYRSQFPLKSPIQLYHLRYQPYLHTTSNGWIKLENKYGNVLVMRKTLYHLIQHKLHWLRSNGVLSMWKQASLPVVNLLPPPSDYSKAAMTDKCGHARAAMKVKRPLLPP